MTSWQRDERMITGWVRITLGEAAEYLNGRGFKTSEWEKTGRPIIRIQNLNDSTADFNRTTKLFEERYSVDEGDLLFAWSASLGVYIWRGEPAWLNQHIFKVIPAIGVEKKFLYYFLRLTTAQLYAEAHGSGMVHVTKVKFAETPFLLPPAPEQSRIVAKIEELFSELDKGVETFTAARAKLKTYRQTLLKHAFEGKLTVQWRTDHAKELESADQLLARVREERAARYQHRLEEWKAQVAQWEADGRPGKKPWKPSSPEEPQPLSNRELMEVPALPVGWHHVRLDELGELGRGKSKHRPRNDPKLFGGGYPFIQTAEVKAASKFITDYSHTYNEIGLAQSKLWPQGTLCITIAANIAETGFLAMDACFPDSVVGFVPSEALVSSGYLELFIQSVRTRIEAYAPATAQKNINLSTLEQLVVPLCPRGEQVLLVNELEAQLSQIDQLERTIDTALEQSEALRQSILKHAFEGQLVPRDPNEEPAAELLARIKAERAERTQPTHSRHQAQAEA